MADNSDPIGAAMVVGGGIAGVQAALDMANAGIKVYLVERRSAIGGKMVQLDKTFPTNDCAMCTSSPRLVDAGRHPNVELLTDAELVRLEGRAGHFAATVRLNPRYIDLDRCTSCGDCAEVCPVVLPSRFDQGLATQRAAYRLYPQAVPNAYAIVKRGIAPCRDACPAGQRAQGYIALIREGRHEDALRVIKEDNPFPAICGRICNHRCEDACNRAKLDEAVNIRALKRFVTDRVYAQPRRAPEPSERRYEERVAIIGAGPCGLTAAQDLCKRGYGVTVFEALPVAGGMLRVGVPEYRLPASIVEREVQDIIDLGVELRLNTRIENLDDVFDEGFDATLIAVGAHEGIRMQIPGAHLDGVLINTAFLRDVRLSNPTALGQQVAVIGAGDVAMDVARTAVRMGSEVHVYYRRTQEEATADEEEMRHAQEEGVVFHWQTTPLGVLGTAEGRVRGLECVRTEQGLPDGTGRRRPVPISGSEHVVACDTVIFSVGQRAGLAFIPESAGVGITGSATIAINPNTLAATRPGVFAAGDATTGTAFVIEAVESGHRAADSIHRYLRGEELEPAPKPNLPVVELTHTEIEGRVKRGEVRPQPRVPLDELPVEERVTTFEEVVAGYTPELAAQEAARCLECGLCSECLSCWYTCQAGAIEHDQVSQIMHLEIGALILSPGYAVYDARRSPELGYGRYSNVVTSLEFERLLSASGPTRGHIARPSDGAQPKRIAFLQCVGSRDQKHGYCSAVCCMYATKEAMLAMEHVPGVEVHIFQMDMRAFGKNFDAYYRRGKERGVVYHNSRLSRLREDPATKEIVAHYEDQDGTLTETRFDLVVLSVGMEPPENVQALVETVGIGVNEHGFAQREPFYPVESSRQGVFVCGTFAEPKDIPDSVVEASGAAASAMAVIGQARGTRVEPEIYPPEHEVSLVDEPRIGCFVCSCGNNIASVVDVAQVTDYATDLPGVVHAENTTYTCSADSLKLIQERVEELGLNRVVVASCTPRTHEPIFRETIRGAGLNPYLFEMANIRDQGSWVHSHEHARATTKATDLVRMAVARSRLLFPLHTEPQAFNHDALVVGGGVAGMTAALNLAEQGYRVYVVERDRELGGRALKIPDNALGGDIKSFLSDLVARVHEHERIEVLTGHQVIKHKGYVGSFQTTVREVDGSRQRLIEHGVVIMATGVEEYAGPAYGLGAHPRILTQGQLEERIAEGTLDPSGLKQVVMIQCVGPWDEPTIERDAPEFYCSRVCCTVAAKNALKLKELNPHVQVFVLCKDVRTYGFREQIYTQAREQGVVYVRFDDAHKPQVEQRNGRVAVTVVDPTLGMPLTFEPDALVLSAAMVPPAGTRELAEMMRFACTPEGFMLEAHLKLRLVDFPTEGAYLCGGIHYPKFIDEAIAQAKAAAARASAILSQDELQVGGEVAVVETDRCTGCLTCVRVCPYDVPIIDPQLIGAGGISGAAQIAPAACRGCGICAAECPAKAIQLQHYRDEQILAEAQALFVDGRRSAQALAV